LDILVPHLDPTGWNMIKSVLNYRQVCFNWNKSVKQCYPSSSLVLRIYLKLKNSLDIWKVTI